VTDSKKLSHDTLKLLTRRELGVVHFFFFFFRFSNTGIRCVTAIGD
jgi:hypothetical protein|tara:strand:+ start:980 stop:1117 length:138 start_codon:yes stop_codon:yes gene_type:complete